MNGGGTTRHGTTPDDRRATETDQDGHERPPMSPDDALGAGEPSVGADYRLDTASRGASVVSRAVALQDRFVAYVDAYAVPVTFYAFAFVYVHFGVQKLIPGAEAPVRESIALFFGTFGVPFAVAGPFVGLFETTLGLLFLSRRLGLVFFPFLANMLVTLASPFVVWYYAWNPPWLNVFGLQVSWAVDWFAAFALGNVVFVAGFLFLTSRVLGADTSADRHGQATTRPPVPAVGIVSMAARTTGAVRADRVGEHGPADRDYLYPDAGVGAWTRAGSCTNWRRPAASAVSTRT
jgi:hypothetical protein